jgi:hypothetical protein
VRRLFSSWFPKKFDKRPIFAQTFRGYPETSNGQHPAIIKDGPKAMLDRLFKPVRDLGYSRFIFWLPAGKIPLHEHVMPSANWMPLSRRDKRHWQEIFEWAKQTRTSIEIYNGWNPHNPHTIEMPRDMLFPPDYTTNESDREFARLNIRPWADLGCKKIWFDWAMLASNPNNRASFLKNAKWLEDQYGIVVGGEAIPATLGKPDMKYISKHPFLAMYKFLMDPKTGRDRGKWRFPSYSEVVCVLNSKGNREYFTPMDYQDLANRGYILAPTTIDQAIAVKQVLK